MKERFMEKMRYIHDDELLLDDYYKSLISCVALVIAAMPLSSDIINILLLARKVT